MSTDTFPLTDVSLWAVYDHPRDYPNCFVARRWIGLKPTNDVIVSPALAALRGMLMANGLTRLDRQTGDDPVIVEVWL